MKRLGMLLVLISVSMFTFAGCKDKKKETKKDGEKTEQKKTDDETKKKTD